MCKHTEKWKELYCPDPVPTAEITLALSHVHLSFPLSTQQFNLPFGCISKLSWEHQVTSSLNPSVGISLTMLWFFSFWGKICLQWNAQILNALFCEFWQMQSRVTKPLLRYGTWVCFFLTLSHAASFWGLWGKFPWVSEAGIHVIFFPSYFWLLGNSEITFVACLQHVHRTWAMHFCVILLSLLPDFLVCYF